MTGSTARPALTDREFRFALEQYNVLAERVTELQREREQWIRHSILATFAFFGWVAVYRDQVARTFMFGMVELQTIYALPVVFNCGGAVRFFFIQRDINRLSNYLAEMESAVLGLPEWLCDLPHGRGVRDRHWHLPSISYWVFIIAVSGLAALFLGFSFGDE